MASWARRRRSSTRRADADGGSELLLSTRSMLRSAQGRPHAALADQLASRVEAQVPDPDFDGWLRIARLLHATGDAQAAAREADAALDWARVWDTPGHVGQALTVHGLITGGDAGLAALRDAVEHLRRSPARLQLARSLVELGAALRRTGRADRGARAAARGARPRIGGRAGRDRRASARGTARDRREGPHRASVRARVADAERAADRRPRELAARPTRDRTDAVRDRQDGRDASRQRLPQARDQLAATARARCWRKPNPRVRLPGPPRSGSLPAR